jgi:hypothetical protein
MFATEIRDLNRDQSFTLGRRLNRGARLKSKRGFSIEFGDRKTPRHPFSSRSSAGLLLLLPDHSLRNTCASFNRLQYQ